MNGLLLIDKPSGVTSHDVVSKVRRALKTKQVGHAGTLDPMATGLLVLCIGEGTKLVQYATSERKVYETRIVFGATTNTLDADGEVTKRESLPARLREELLALSQGRECGESLKKALAIETARTEQVPPKVSAIHVDGRRAHDLVRQGVEFELASRSVIVHSIDILGAGVENETIIENTQSTNTEPQQARETGWLDLRVDVSKGYYVRSLAADLSATLGSCAHLSRLRRLRSGQLGIEQAVTLDAPEILSKHVIGMNESVAKLLPIANLTDTGSIRARQGKALTVEDFTMPPLEGVHAWLFEGGLIALGEKRDEFYRVVRGFSQS